MKPLTPLSYHPVTPPNAVANNAERWPCAKCSASNLCDDCYAIKRADERQRYRIAAAWEQVRYVSGLEEERNLGKTPGPKNKPVRGIAHEDGKSELPASLVVPTAKRKLNEKLGEVNALILTYERGARECPEQKESFGRTATALRLFKPMLQAAFELGRDSVMIAPVLRYCSACPKWSTPLEKGKQFCPEHRAKRRADGNRKAQQRRRKRLATAGSKQLSSDFSSVRTGMILKRQIVGLMRRDDSLTLGEAAERLGVTALEACCWSVADKDFGKVVNAMQIAKICDVVLYADDLVRSRRKLSEHEQCAVAQARKLVEELPVAYPGEFDFLKGGAS